jgi:SagB-type dehydrogenase family enzyme
MLDRTLPVEAMSSLRLVAGLAVVEAPDSLVVTGTQRRQIFRGKAAVHLLPRLLPLLDGSRAPMQICREVDMSPQQLDTAVALLDRCGLLDWSPGTGTVPAPEPQVFSYHARTKNSLGYQGTSELVGRLAGSRVDVAGDAAMGEELADDLRRSGVGSVRLVESADDVLGDDPVVGQTALLVALTRAGHRDASSAVVRAAGHRGTTVLPVRVGATHLEFGPYLLPGFSTCTDCLEHGRRDAGWNATASTPPARDAAELAVGMTAAEVVSILVGSTGMKLVQRLARLSLDDFGMERFVPAPRDGCAVCGTGVASSGSASSPDAAMVEQYEWVNHLPPALLISREGGKRSSERADALQSERPRFSSHPRRPLPGTSPRVHGTFGHEEAPSGPLAGDDEYLGALLQRTAGLRRSSDGLPLQRWAPSGGNLGSVELYLARDGGFAGLPGSLFRYDDLEHSVVSVRPDEVPIAELLNGTDLAGNGPYAAVVVMSGAHARCSAKYEQHAHRLVHLDAGCATTQLTTVARGYGLEVDWARSWDGGLAGTLCLDTKKQLVTAVAGIRRKNTEEGQSCR